MGIDRNEKLQIPWCFVTVGVLQPIIQTMDAGEKAKEIQKIIDELGQDKTALLKEIFAQAQIAPGNPNMPVSTQQFEFFVKNYPALKKALEQVKYSYGAPLHTLGRDLDGNCQFYDNTIAMGLRLLALNHTDEGIPQSIQGEIKTRASDLMAKIYKVIIVEKTLQRLRT